MTDIDERMDRTIDALGNRTFPFALQLGAGDGVLSERLAPRCGRLITLESSWSAVESARSRLELVPNVDARHATVPQDLPAWTFDLVVCADVLQTFADLPPVLDALERLMPRAATLLAVHTDGDDVHAVLRARPGLVRMASVSDDDYVLERYERR